MKDVERPRPSLRITRVRGHIALADSNQSKRSMSDGSLELAANDGVNDGHRPDGGESVINLLNELHACNIS